jgi:mono/diheme cytochrome c family protein
VKRIFKWLKRIGLTLVVVAAAAGAILYFASEHVLKRQYPVPLAAFTVPTDASAIERGRHLASIYGCNNCHAVHFEGTQMGAPLLGHINAPNLTRAVRELSDTELEHVIRHGVKPDGTSIMMMPANMFSHLSDADLGAILAFVRSAPKVEGGLAPDLTLWPLGRWMVLSGAFTPIATQIEPDSARAAVFDRADPIAFGQYLALGNCTECHGAHLQGDPAGMPPTPNLVIVAAYDKPTFTKLMRTGVALGGRQLTLMREAALGRFTNYTDDEIGALYAFLRDRAAHSMN